VSATYFYRGEIFMNSINKTPSIANLQNININSESKKVNAEGVFSGKSVEVQDMQAVTPNPSNTFSRPTNTPLSSRSAEQSVSDPALKASAMGAAKLWSIND
jgi:hypothetical protein